MSDQIEIGDDYEWREWLFSCYGVPWRMGGSALKKFEQLERQRWRVFWITGDCMVLRRKRKKKK